MSGALGYWSIPHAASAALESYGTPGVVALVSLYQQAHRTGYAERSWTEERIAEAWGCGRKVAVAMLEDLVLAGCVEVTFRAATGSRQQSRLRVFDPLDLVAEARKAREGRRSEVAGTSNSDSGNENDAPPTPTNRGEERGTERDTELRADQVDRARRKQSTPEQVSAAGVDAPAREPRPAPPAGPDPQAVAELVALQANEEAQHGFPIPGDADWSAVERALQRGVTPASLRALWAYSGSSDDASIAGCREDGPKNWRRWRSLLKAPLGPERLAKAIRWDADGRPVEARPVPEARAGPAPPRRGAKPTPGDGVLAELRLKRARERGNDVIDAGQVEGPDRGRLGDPGGIRDRPALADRASG